MMDTPVEPNVQFTVQTAAEAAGVSTKTIRRWITSGRLRAEGDGSPGEPYTIDQADLAQAKAAAASSPVDGQQPTPTPQLALRLRQQAGSAADMIGALSSALSAAVTDPLYDRLERQAEEIGQLRAQLAVATTPKAPRPARPSTTPRRPRVSVPLDSAEDAMRKLAQTYDPAELARIARRLK